MPCLAYRFGDRFAFSGDSEAFEALAAFADGVIVGSAAVRAAGEGPEAVGRLVADLAAGCREGAS